MINYADTNFIWSRKDNVDAEDNLHTFIAVAIGIDGMIQHAFGTYVNFFELLSSNAIRVDSSSNYSDGKFYIDFINNNEIIETLEAPEKIWALLLSEPDIIEIARDARTPPSYLRDGIRYYVKEGWGYVKTQDDYEFMHPSSWTLPPDANDTIQDKYDKQMITLNSLKEAYKNANYLHPDFIAKLNNLG